MIIAVSGGGACNQTTADLARETGRLLARNGVVLLCGGLGGVMAAAAQGVKEAGGTSVGLLPGKSPDDANEYITIPLATNMGHARNVLLVQAADAIIAFHGGSGTLSEIALGLKMGRKVVCLEAWNNIKGVIVANTPVEAVSLAIGKKE